MVEIQVIPTYPEKMKQIFGELICLDATLVLFLNAIVGHYLPKVDWEQRFDGVLKHFGSLKLSQFRGQGAALNDQIFLKMVLTSDDGLTSTNQFKIKIV